MGAGRGAATGVFSAVPQCLQNFACGEFSWWHFGQGRLSGLPQLSQKRASSGFSVKQVEHFTDNEVPISGIYKLDCGKEVL
jgi:hypothetical protein